MSSQYDRHHIAVHYPAHLLMTSQGCPMYLKLGAYRGLCLRPRLIEANDLTGGIIKLVVVELELEESRVEGHLNLRREGGKFEIHRSVFMHSFEMGKRRPSERRASKVRRMIPKAPDIQRLPDSSMKK